MAEPYDYLEGYGRVQSIDALSSIKVLIETPIFMLLCRFAEDSSYR